MALFLKREEVRHLRQKGLSINDIAKRLKASKSSVSYWCRDIVLSREQILHLDSKRKIAGLRALLQHAERVRGERIVRVSEQRSKGAIDVGDLSDRDFFILGLALYWGEGYKDKNGEVGFTNTNFEMIKIMMRWFHKFYVIQFKDFILRVSINQDHKQRVNKILKFWSRQTGIPLTQFSKTSLLRVKARKQYSNSNNYYGTLRFKVRRATALKQRILGSISVFEKIN